MLVNLVICCVLCSGASTSSAGSMNVFVAEGVPITKSAMDEGVGARAIPVMYLDRGDSVSPRNSDSGDSWAFADAVMASVDRQLAVPPPPATRTIDHSASSLGGPGAEINNGTAETACAGSFSALNASDSEAARMSMAESRNSVDSWSFADKIGMLS